MKVSRYKQHFCLKIALPAVFQLLVFLYPTVIRTAHQHQNHAHQYHSTQGTTLSQWEKPCAICQFEFDTHVKSETPLFYSNNPSVSTIRVEHSTSVINAAFSFISLRAPPVAS